MSRAILYAGLFVSLALNVFVGGAFLGAYLAGGKAQRPEPQVRNPVAAAVRTLPPEQQAAWREGLPEFARTYGPKVRESRRLLRETLRGFGAEPFDPDATLANLQRARALEHESRMAMDGRLVTFAAGLPKADRARFGAALARPQGLGGRDRRGAALPDR